jgi:hypothetical protein
MLMDNHPVSAEDLFAHAHGDLDQRTASAIAAHVAMCPACAATLARFEIVRMTIRADATLTPTALTSAWIRALIASRKRPAVIRQSAFAPLKRVVAALKFDGRAPLALGELRGSAEAYLVKYAADDLDVDLEIAPAGTTDGGRWQVTGQVSAPLPSGSYVLAFTEPGGKQPVIELQSDDDGMFFVELSSGPYDLLVQTSDTVVVIPNLEVG